MCVPYQGIGRHLGESRARRATRFIRTAPIAITAFRLPRTACPNEIKRRVEKSVME